MTLVEVLVVLTILSVGLIPLVGLNTGQFRQSSQSAYQLQAHAHLINVLQHAENRVHVAGFDLTKIQSQSCRTLTTAWGHNDRALVTVEENTQINESQLQDGLLIIEAAVTWRESRGKGWRRFNHKLTKLLCSPWVGQEAL